MGQANQINRHAKNPTVTIASGQTVSSALNFDAYDLGNYFIPASFTGTTIQFQVSYDGTTYVLLYDSTNTVKSQTVATSRAYDLPTEAAGACYIKLVSGSAEAGDRTINFSVKG